MKTVSISAFTIATLILISGCVARPHYPIKTVFNNGVTYEPTWDGYSSCWAYNDKPYAECKANQNGPVVKVLYPDIDATIQNFTDTYTTLNNLCNYVIRLQLLPNRSACEDKVREQLHLNVEKLTYSKMSDVEKAYQIGLIDKKTWLLYKGRILEAYQSGLIDKDMARTKMLKWGQIVEAYEAKLIDKDTADLYLKQKQIRDATIASQQQAAAIKKAADDTAWNQQMLQQSQYTNQIIQNMQNNNQLVQPQLQNKTKIIYY